MYFELRGERCYASTGGRAFQPDQPWLVLLHGAGSNHLAWTQQSRALAFDGWNVFVPDLPGHGHSSGEPIPTVEAQAAWILEAMDVVGCRSAVFAGHSMGGLILLEIARKTPERLDGAIFIATATAIPVNDRLIRTAKENEPAAFDAMVAWAHGPQAHQHGNPWPGGSQLFTAWDVMASNQPGALAVDLQACADYAGGEEAAKAVNAPALCLFARRDRMVPAKAGIALAGLLGDPTVIVMETPGHTIPSEAPLETNAAIRDFLSGHSAEAA